jgi:hypothetical protein
MDARNASGLDSTSLPTDWLAALPAEILDILHRLRCVSRAHRGRYTDDASGACV